MSATINPVETAALTYMICAVIAMSVAGVIHLLFGIIKLRKRKDA